MFIEEVIKQFTKFKNAYKMISHSKNFFSIQKHQYRFSSQILTKLIFISYNESKLYFKRILRLHHKSKCKRFLFVFIS